MSVLIDANTKALVLAPLKVGEISGGAQTSHRAILGSSQLSIPARTYDTYQQEVANLRFYINNTRYPVSKPRPNTAPNTGLSFRVPNDSTIYQVPMAGNSPTSSSDYLAITNGRIFKANTFLAGVNGAARFSAQSLVTLTNPPTGLAGYRNSDGTLFGTYASSTTSLVIRTINPISATAWTNLRTVTTITTVSLSAVYLEGFTYPATVSSKASLVFYKMEGNSISIARAASDFTSILTINFLDLTYPIRMPSKYVYCVLSAASNAISVVDPNTANSVEQLPSPPYANNAVAEINSDTLSAVDYGTIYNTDVSNSVVLIVRDWNGQRTIVRSLSDTYNGYWRFLWLKYGIDFRSTNIGNAVFSQPAKLIRKADRLGYYYFQPIWYTPTTGSASAYTSAAFLFDLDNDLNVIDALYVTSGFGNFAQGATYATGACEWLKSFIIIYNQLHSFTPIDITAYDKREVVSIVGGKGILPMSTNIYNLIDAGGYYITSMGGTSVNVARYPKLT